MYGTITACFIGMYLGLDWKKEEINIKVSETQIGGSHYSEMAIQPIEFIHKTIYHLFRAM